MKEKLRFIAAFVIIMLAGCSGTTETNYTEKSEQTVKKEMKLANLNSEEINISQFKGKTVFLNFWATWCKPCIAEMPSIEEAQEALKDSEVVFLLASNEPKAKIEKFIKTHDFDLEFIMLTSPIEDLDIMALPTTYIYAPDGKIVFSEMGGKNWSTSENLALILQNQNL